MRSLSSTVREIPSSWLPSRRVVSKTSTTSGSALSISTSADMFDPVLVAVHLAPDSGEVDLLDGLGHRPRLADHPVVDLADGHDLGRRPRQEGLVAHVQFAAQDVADRGF